MPAYESERPQHQSHVAMISREFINCLLSILISKIPLVIIRDKPHWLERLMRRRIAKAMFEKAFPQR